MGKVKRCEKCGLYLYSHIHTGGVVMYYCKLGCGIYSQEEYDMLVEDGK